MRVSTSLLAGGALLAGLCFAGSVQAQSIRRTSPLLKQTAPLGVAGDWARARHPHWAGYFQTVKFEIPGGGFVTVYDDQHQEHGLESGGLIELQIGPVYRFRLGEMKDFPNVELYPTVELLSRLHPPEGRKHEFPIPLAFTAQEIAAAAAGRMVTKAVYLEQPNLATPAALREPLPTQPVSRSEDALSMADEVGRPMAILRMGGRRPSGERPSPAFMGPGGPVQLPR